MLSMCSSPELDSCISANITTTGQIFNKEGLEICRDTGALYSGPHLKNRYLSSGKCC